MSIGAFLDGLDFAEAYENNIFVLMLIYKHHYNLKRLQGIVIILGNALLCM